LTEALIPRRNPACFARSIRLDETECHEPRVGTVESEYNAEMEWQFATCRHCDQSISRFRMLVGGLWFDRWGDLEGAQHSSASQGMA
jgi:hypothetical protein